MTTQQEISEKIAQYNQNRVSLNKDVFCYVPFMNILFTQEGQVKTCCYNDRAYLGRYPELSIEDMWSSEMVLTTRQLISRNELAAAGCQYCEKMLLQNKFYGIKPGTYDQYLPYLNSKQPIVLEFELSNVCNLECIMCNGHASSAIRKNREKLPILNSPYDDAFVEQLRSLLPQVKEARFFGGEPFLIDIYYKIWDLILQVNPDIRVYVLTNGTIWNDRIAELVSRLNIDLGVSIDAVDKRIFEFIRKNASFEKVIHNLKNMQRIYLDNKLGRSITISATPIQENIEQIPLLVDFCNQNQFYLWLSTVDQPQSLSLAYLEKKQLQKYLESLSKKTFANKTSWEIHNLSTYQGFLNQLSYWINIHE